MKARLLLVEDNPINVYLATFLLEQHGFTVEQAGNGIECLARVRAAPPDIILLDLQMPLMDGYETVRELMADPGTAGIPVIAVTAYAMAGDRTKALALGFRDYIEKPYDTGTFAARVESHLIRPASENPHR